MLDVAIVGGGVAGLSAALVLGRSRREVMVFDTGKPCNRFSHASHGFFTRDGILPAELMRLGQAQLRPYETVKYQPEAVTTIQAQASGFAITTATGEKYTAKKVLLAYGLTDQLPEIEGMQTLWGQSVFHCPYCDGWEVRDQPLAVYGSGNMSFHQLMMIWHWSKDVVWLTTGDISPEQDALVQQHGIRVIQTPIHHLEGRDGKLQCIHFVDGTTLARKAIFLRPQTTHHTPLAYQLGCAINDNGVIQIDVLGRTSVTDVYAAGDIASPMRSVTVSAAQGSTAAAGINFDLIEASFHHLSNA